MSIEFAGRNIVINIRGRRHIMDRIKFEEQLGTGLPDDVVLAREIILDTVGEL